MIDRTPPADITAEAAVLGSMILDPRAIDVAAELLAAEDFYRPAHGELFTTLCRMRDEGEPVDLVSLKGRLVDAGALGEIGGVEYLAALVEGVPSASNAEYYAQHVAEKARLRDLIRAADSIRAEAFGTVDDPQGVVDRAEQTVFAVARRASGGREPVGMDSLMDEVSHLLDRDREQDGIPSGYRDLDALTGGFHGGELVIVAARPSMGKTALLLSMAERLALEGVPVAVFSLEMSRQQVAQRLWCSYGRFDLRRLRQNMMSEPERRTLEKARQRLRAAPIYTDDDPGLTVAQLRARARRLKAAHDVQVVLVDYLQLLQPTDERASRTVQVGQMSWGLKALAKEIEVPVIAAAQLNRRVTDRSDFRPRMSDLRESGSIEQDADLVCLLHSEDYYHRGEPGYQGGNPHELIVAKQRNGPTGTVRMTFLPDCTRFEPATWPGVGGAR